MEWNNGTVHVDLSVLQWIVFAFIPWLTSLVSRRFADDKVKAAIIAVLTVVVAVLQDGMQNDGNFDIATIIGKFVAGLVTAFVTHQFVWKPLGVTGDRGVIARTVPAGIGKPTVYQMERASGSQRAA